MSEKNQSGNGPSIQIGTWYNTDGLIKDGETWYSKEPIKFPLTFNQTPAVVVSFNQIGLNVQDNPHIYLTVTAENITPSSFGIKIYAPQNTNKQLFNIGVSWVAISQ